MANSNRVILPQPMPRMADTDPEKRAAFAMAMEQLIKRARAEGRCTLSNKTVESIVYSTAITVRKSLYLWRTKDGYLEPSSTLSNLINIGLDEDEIVAIHALIFD